MATCGCPDAVVFTLRRIVQTELDRVRAIIRMSELFDRASKDVIAGADAEVGAAVDAIPTFSAINLLDLVDYLTCPLTPLALFIQNTSELSNLDPRVAMAKVKELRAGEIEQSRIAYLDQLENANSAGIIKGARKYTSEIRRLKFDAESFTYAVIVAATVLAICGVEEYQAGPYQEFANVIVDFSMENGIPSNLSQNTQAVVQKLLNGEAKFDAARKTIADITI